MDFFTSTTVIDSIKFRVFGRKILSGAAWISFYKRSRKKGVRIFIYENGEIHVECSLPRFVFGHNGVLLASQAEIDAAMNELIVWLKQGLSNAWKMEFSRIDICWHFEGKPDFFIACLCQCTHPQIHGLPSTKPHQSLWWAKPNSVRRLTGYDKEMQLNHRAGEIMRFELSLRRHALQNELNGSNPVQRLDFGLCYKALRKALLLFNPKPRVQLKRGQSRFKQMIAKLALEGNPTVIEEYAELYKRKESASKFRKEIRSINLTVGAIDFSKLLPLDAPPPAIHVYPKKHS